MVSGSHGLRTVGSGNPSNGDADALPGDRLLQRVRELRRGAHEKAADWLAHLVAKIIRMRCQLQCRCSEPAFAF